MMRVVWTGLPWLWTSDAGVSLSGIGRFWICSRGVNGTVSRSVAVPCAVGRNLPGARRTLGGGCKIGGGSGGAGGEWVVCTPLNENPGLCRLCSDPRRPVCIHGQQYGVECL